MVQAPCDGGGRYHSRAAWDDRAGAFPLQKGTKRQEVTTLPASRVEPWSVLRRLTPDTLRGEAFLLCPETYCGAHRVRLRAGAARPYGRQGGI